jgi:hypothetical protein
MEHSRVLGKAFSESVARPQLTGVLLKAFRDGQTRGKWRPVIDLKALNGYLKVPRFTMESLQSNWGVLLPRNFVIFMDLQDAYFLEEVPENLSCCHAGTFTIKFWSLHSPMAIHKGHEHASRGALRAIQFTYI